MSISYRERLLPRWGIVLLLLMGPLALGVAYGTAVGALAGWLVLATSAAAGLVVVLLTTPRIEVSAAGLSAGPAVLPPWAIGETTELDADGRRLVLATQATVFTVLRTWHASTAVRVAVVDAQDPHPAWVLTTRHPSRLAAALAAIRTLD